MQVATILVSALNVGDIIYSADGRLYRVIDFTDNGLGNIWVYRIKEIKCDKLIVAYLDQTQKIKVIQGAGQSE